MEKYREAINNIVQEITEKYKLEKNMLPLGYKILCHKEDRNCLTLSENFFLFFQKHKRIISADRQRYRVYGNI